MTKPQRDDSGTTAATDGGVTPAKKTSRNSKKSEQTVAAGDLATGHTKRASTQSHHSEHHDISKYQQKGCVINPEDWRLRRWDLVTATFLIFVCFVSPFEVAFIKGRDDVEFLQNGADGLFWVNRVVDIVFIVDMILQFFLMYPIHRQHGTVYVGAHHLIVKNYLRTWFPVDFVSILPFDLISALLESNEASRLKVLRIVRLFRLLKLIRLFRGMRILKRWELEHGMSYRKMTLWSLLIIVVVAAHWISCILGIMVELQADGGPVCMGDSNKDDECIQTWITPAAEDMIDNGLEMTAWRAWVVSLYVAATIIVHPHSYAPKNEDERVPFIILIFIGGFIWTKVISRSTAITTSLDSHNIHYQQTMDDLNAITEDLAVPQKLRRRLREFFMYTKDSSKRQTWEVLKSRMSPVLRTEVSYQLNKGWLVRIKYLSTCSKLFLRDVTAIMSMQFFAQEETFGENFRLYILSRGICTWGKGAIGRRKGQKATVLTAGAVWGEEHLLLNKAHLLIPNTASAVAFCEVLSIAREAFQKVCEEYPEYQPHFRHHYVNYAVKRAVIVEAEARRSQKSSGSLDSFMSDEYTHQVLKARRASASSLQASSLQASQRQALKKDFTAEVNEHQAESPTMAMLNEVLTIAKSLRNRVDELENRGFRSAPNGFNPEPPLCVVDSHGSLPGIDFSLPGTGRTEHWRIYNIEERLSKIEHLLEPRRMDDGSTINTGIRFSTTGIGCCENYRI